MASRPSRVAGAGRMVYPPPPETQLIPIIHVKLQGHKKDKFWGRVSLFVAVRVPGVETVEVERCIQTAPTVFN
jgi:hypothetical protein